MQRLLAAPQAPRYLSDAPAGEHQLHGLDPKLQRIRRSRSRHEMHPFAAQPLKPSGIRQSASIPDGPKPRYRSDTKRTPVHLVCQVVKSVKSSSLSVLAQAWVRASCPRGQATCQTREPGRDLSRELAAPSRPEQERAQEGQRTMGARQAKSPGRLRVATSVASTRRTSSHHQRPYATRSSDNVRTRAPLSADPHLSPATQQNCARAGASGCPSRGYSRGSHESVRIPGRRRRRHRDTAPGTGGRRQPTDR